MEKQDYTASITVNATAQEAFNAINNPRGWWSENIDGGTEKLNDEFIYHYQDIHYCKIKLIEVVPDQKVVWLVLDNYFKFTKDKNEWIGTKMVFDILQKDLPGSMDQLYKIQFAQLDHHRQRTTER